jgi:alpha-D-ribose 1-methylphosphonate 5-phosphate C-P lyase
MSATFRELFDEEEREEMHIALTARVNGLKSRLKRANEGTEQAPNQVTIERLEQNIAMVQRMIRTVAEESN